MKELPLVLTIASSLGFLTKLVDLEVDEKIDLKGLSTLFALIYGLIMVFAIRTLLEISSLILAVIIAVVAAGKVDNFHHGIGVGTALAGTLILGLPSINPVPFFLFLSTALLDEIVSDLADMGKLTGRLGSFFKIRPFLELSAFAYSLYTKHIEFWMFIFLYDVSYQLTSRIFRSRITHQVT